MKAVVASLLVTLALAQNQRVDQGKPGSQGPWPVRATSGGWTPDGGFFGTLVVTQGTTLDGGQAWNIAGQGGASTFDTWTRLGSFNLSAWLDGGNTLTTAERLAIGFPADGGAFGAEELASSTTTTTHAIRLTDVSAISVQLNLYVNNANTGISCAAKFYGSPTGPLWDGATYGSSSTSWAGVVFPFNSSGVAVPITNGGSTLFFGPAVYTVYAVGASYGFISYMNSLPPALTVLCQTSTATLTSATSAFVEIWGLQ